MKREIWPTKIHYEHGNEDLAKLMFQSNVVGQHENKWFKDTDEFTAKLYEKIMSAVSETWKEELPKDAEVKLNLSLIHI